VIKKQCDAGVAAGVAGHRAMDNIPCTETCHDRRPPLNSVEMNMDLRGDIPVTITVGLMAMIIVAMGHRTGEEVCDCNLT
jgi:hypothetical protein